MPSGRTHDRITFFCLPWLVALCLIITRNPRLTLILAVCFLFSGLMFGPDLDIYSVQVKRWGPLAWLWLPYQKFLRHRSLFSHGLIIGTIVRLSYLLCVLTILAIQAVGIGQLIWGYPWNWQDVAQTLIKSISSEFFPEAIAAYLGLELGSMSHSLADWIVSATKRKQKKHKKISRLRKGKKIRR